MRMEECAAGRGPRTRQQARPRESARSRIGPLSYKVTTRAERATSVGMLGKMSSSRFVDTHNFHEGGPTRIRTLISGFGDRYSTIELWALRDSFRLSAVSLQEKQCDSISS